VPLGGVGKKGSRTGTTSVILSSLRVVLELLNEGLCEALLEELDRAVLVLNDGRVALNARVKVGS
jgi:hypothetical protein